MLLGRVVGTLVATNKEPSLEGLKFLVLRQLGIDGAEASGYRVAADAVGAGLDLVTDKRPCDAVIMAIVDSLAVDGEVTYDKSRDG